MLEHDLDTKFIMSFSVSRKNSLYVECDQHDAPRTLAIRDRPWKPWLSVPPLSHTHSGFDCDLFALLRCFLDTGRLSVSRLEERESKPSNRTKMISQAFRMYICAVVNGLNTGIPGLSTFATTTLVVAREEGALARRFFGILLPVLLSSDLTASYQYRKTARWDIVRDVTLPIAVGMFTGFLVLGKVDSGGMRRVIGAIVIIMSLVFYGTSLIDGQAGASKVTEDDLPTKAVSTTPGAAQMLDSKNASKARSLLSCLKSITSTGVFRAVLAFVTGTLAVISNGASLIMIVYLLSLNLPPRTLNGTRANIFLVINCSKIPGSILLGTLHLSIYDAYIIIPLCIAAMLSAYTVERYVVPGLNQANYERFTWVVILCTSIAMLFL